MNKNALKGTSLTRRSLLGGAAAAGVMLAAPVVWAQSATVKVGMFFPMQLALAKDMREGMELAIEQINAQGGILGRQVELAAYEDETYDPEAGINAYNKLVNSDKVDVLVGGGVSGNVLAWMPRVPESRVPTFLVSTASPAITVPIERDHESYKSLFRMILNSDQIAAAMGDWVDGMLVQELGYKRIAIVAENAKWAQDLVKALEPKIVAAGAELTITELFDVNTQDFAPVLSRIQSSNPEFMVAIVGAASQSDILNKQIFDSKFPIPYGGQDSKFYDLEAFNRIDGKVIGQINSTYGLRAPITERTIAYFDAHLARFGRDPNFTAWHASDALYIYKEAVERAGGFDFDPVIAEIEKTDYVGVAGHLSFDSRHDLETGPGKSNMIFFQWQDGGKRTLLWPREIRDGEPILPPWITR